MPKKTKRQKILSQKRRSALFSVTSLDTSAQIHEDSKNTEPRDSRTGTHVGLAPMYQFRDIATRVKRDASGQLPSQVTAVRADLVKTIILAGMAIGVEFILYWMLR